MRAPSPTLWLGIVGLTLIGLLAACSGGSGGLQRPTKDGPPGGDVDVSRIPDAVPKYEPITRAGNKNPYEILGKTYRLLPSSRGYREVGIASWYGSKFHGQNTANGEPYSMYTMNAAHTRLPIPSYARVTNLENGRSVIVRVNDRGPFHDNRVIDLSYVAAKKLGYAEKGTARVEVVAIDPADYQRNSVEAPRLSSASVLTKPPLAGTPDGGGDTFLQVGSFASAASAKSLQRRLTKVTDYPVVVRSAEQDHRSLFRVVIGPVAENNQLDRLRLHLRRGEGLNSIVVRAGAAVSD
ncbi:MAG: septal ring lytic transglycosylase RlpA family protein [Porticoccaceae bacterium]